MTAVSITSKNQITLPSKTFGKFKKGQKFIAQKKGKSIILTPAENIVHELSGIIKSDKKIDNMEKVISDSFEGYIT